MTKLSKFIAQSGYCSRRKAADLIKAKQVTVNGIIVEEPYYEVQSTDAIKVEKKLIHLQKKLYFLFNKPKDVISTISDPQGRTTIAQFFEKFKERLYPIGRLDRNTTGLMIVTNDGELTQKLAHPRYNIAKTYSVQTHKPVSKEHIATLLRGVKLEDGVMKADKIRIVPKIKNTLCVTIHSGKKHIIKRMFKQIGYFVKKLDRTHFAILSKRGLAIGSYRALSVQEIDKLNQLSNKPTLKKKP